MTIKIHVRTSVGPGAFRVYTIDARKEPIIELYSLDSGYLVLGATTTGGYMRRLYKCKSSACRWADQYAKTFCRLYWDEVEIVRE